MTSHVHVREMLANLDPADLVGRLVLSDALEEVDGDSLTVKLLRATHLAIAVVSHDRYGHVVYPSLESEAGYEFEGQSIWHGWINTQWEGTPLGGAYIDADGCNVVPYACNEMCGGGIRPTAHLVA